ncbi:hypothetical protein J3L16_12240 [Alteromonas sp. 5E99-2]|uniref:hypothetical protein n=1 Tax=Alteromonas sp. 5E99-2 TaxID=2817683 RepID=UPI001A97E3A0|nr:hypothetical protein [Alteromonas sp. 5E99-2]MBO1256453.1 hypothetical protein [Alteromonas sp. 5E99-2]
MKELNINEIKAVNGAISNNAAWGASIGAAVAFVGFAVAVSNPIGAGIFAAASIVSSSTSFFYADAF